MNFEPELIEYCVRYSTPTNVLLNFIERQTNLRFSQSGMMSDPLQGKLLSFLAQMIQPRKILELGTFTGYSTLCLAQSLKEGGHIISIEKEEEVFEWTQNWVKNSEWKDKISLKLGEALQIIPTLSDVFDVIFIDADKKHTREYYELCLSKLRKNGLLLIDNVLWKGKVLTQEDSIAKIMNELNIFIKNDMRVTNLLLPIRDGLMLVLKI